MNLLHLARRAAGKSTPYLLRWTGRNLGRYLGARRLRQRLSDLSVAHVLAACRADSAAALWSASGVARLTPAAAERRALRQLHRDLFAADAAALRARASQVKRQTFDLLGSGPVFLGPEIDWQTDFKSGRRWPLVPSLGIEISRLDQPADVKVPWELSRGQYLPALAQVWVLDRDREAVAEFERLLRSWIRSNPVGLGVNWACTMDVALRAVSWIWALTLLDDAPLCPEFRDQVLLSLFQHGSWIANNIELGEFNGNHFISDALGLVACGALFRASKEGQRWLESGAAMLEQEIRAQIGEDGVDVEASVAYHRLVLEIFLVGRRFLGAADRVLSAEFDRRLELAFDFLQACITPEGKTPVVGDADDGRALVLSTEDVRDHRYLLSAGAVLFRHGEWKARAGRLSAFTLWFLGPEVAAVWEALPALSEERSMAFTGAGFFVMRAPGSFLFVDAGPVGFFGRGGHGHNDILSFEWHALGQPLLTDSGAYVYTASTEWRNRFRSTGFHSGIQVDGEEVNRFPSAIALWTLRNDAIPRGVSFRRGEQEDTLTAGHGGYLRLRDPVLVRRAFRFDRRAPRLRMEDTITCAGPHRVEFRFHAAVGAIAERLSPREVRLDWPGGARLRIGLESGVDVEWVADRGWFSPSYGVKVERPVWVASAVIGSSCSFSWRLEASMR